MNKITSSPEAGHDVALEWTGERFLPSVSGQIRYEHLHRYAACVELVSGKRVLDIACGEGYGSEILSVNAHEVVGVDVDPTAIRHASKKYADLGNTRFLEGSVDNIPLDTGSVDVAISFETIEHVECHEEMLQEIKRVLTAEGLLIISTPDKATYARFSEELNEFHVKELHVAEFEALLRPLFHNVSMLGQRMVTCSHLQPVSTRSAETAYDAWTLSEEAGLEKTLAQVTEPVYMLALCSNSDLPDVRSSIYLDGKSDLFMEYVEKLQWAVKLDKDYRALAAAQASLSVELEQMNRWATELNQQSEMQVAEIQRLNHAYTESQAWASELNQQREALAVELNQERQVAFKQNNSLSFTLKNLRRLLVERIPFLGSKRSPAVINSDHGVQLDGGHQIQSTAVQPPESTVLPETAVDSYQARVAKEAEHFAQRADVHDLPAVFHYWSNKYLLPKFKEMNIRGVHEFFADVITEKAPEKGQTKSVVVSIGCGNCDIEIAVARELLTSGFDRFQIECVDLIPEMLERGRAMAVAEGLEEYFTFNCTDIISWSPESSETDVVIANQSLHHFVDLEVLFDKIKSALTPKGVFATMDVIGRNGHMRWPEAMEQIDLLWEEMPKRHRYNNLLCRFEEKYENWDCSVEGFEGIRAQDILPLLLERFNFKMFLGYGNLTDIFVDRAFGHNFNLENPQDLAFIDKVGKLDDELIESGELKPTHIVAIMTNEQVESKHYKNLSPSFCVRPTDS